jgi:hypothetical protein
MTVSSVEVQSDLYAAHDVVEATAVPVLAVAKVASTTPSGTLALDTSVHVPPLFVEVKSTWSDAKTQIELPWSAAVTSPGLSAAGMVSGVPAWVNDCPLVLSNKIMVSPPLAWETVAGIRNPEGDTMG